MAENTATGDSSQTVPSHVTHEANSHPSVKTSQGEVSSYYNKATGVSESRSKETADKLPIKDGQRKKDEAKLSVSKDSDKKATKKTKEDELKTDLPPIGIRGSQSRPDYRRHRSSRDRFHGDQGYYDRRRGGPRNQGDYRRRDEDGSEQGHRGKRPHYRQPSKEQPEQSKDDQMEGNETGKSGNQGSEARKPGNQGSEARRSDKSRPREQQQSYGRKRPPRNVSDNKGSRSPRNQRREMETTPRVLQRQSSRGDKDEIVKVEENLTTPKEEDSFKVKVDPQPPDKLQNKSKEKTKKLDSHNYTKPKSDRQTVPDKKPRSRPRGRKTAPTVQSDQLAQELTAGTYECMVCCERVRGHNQVWSCEGCFHVFHLKCIKKWASAPVPSLFNDEPVPEGWQCPSCRNTSTIVPTVYRCFCGRMINPRQKNRGEMTVPHTCGELCLKKLAVGPDSNCRHKCRLPCHPGPCPPCPVMVTRTCPCGSQPHQVRCSRTGDLPSCGGVCGRGLACGRHSCEDTCHPGACRKCEEVLTQQCFCGRETKQSCCGEVKSQVFSCGQICNRELNCGNHLCELLCHDGQCPSCPLLPTAVNTCPCGATPLSRLLAEGNERMSCLDPVPTCEKVCSKTLPCSSADNVHSCLSLCHHGDCPSCDKTSTIQCLCGRSTTSVPCVEVVGGMGEEFRCGRVCNKKKSCGRHRCNTRCCVDSEHVCELLCAKKLRCGLHSCQENCHSGHCQQCWEYSYDELTCHCGAEVIYPPISCGTRPPVCPRPCARMHPCGHPVTHNCHSDDVCPPCTFLVEKMCMGNHELRRNIPCHLADVSCGSLCGQPLSCGMHKCQRTCHRGNCSELPCQQPCTHKRKSCDHECKEACHVGRECPDTPCQSTVELKCECGRRRERVICMASESGAMQQAFQMFSKELGTTGESISINAVTVTSRHRHKQLDCDEICKQMKRNRELASALDIDNAIVNPLEFGSSGETVQYSPFLMEEARSDLEFVSDVEEALRALVESAIKGSTNKTHKHSFRPMKNNQRKIIHELSVHYGCETTSYDSEPVRNVTAYVTKLRARLPLLPLSKLVERERYRPPPAPVHVMAVSERGAEAGTNRKLDWLRDGIKPASSVAVPDYFADDLKL